MYAENTSVTVEKSVEEIRQALNKVNAEGFFLGALDGNSYIGFYYQGRAVKMIFSIPQHPGKDSSLLRLKKFEQARRTKWRQILLTLKAKFESVACGIESFEQAFMAHIVLSDGTFFGDECIKRLNDQPKGIPEQLDFKATAT